MTNPAQSLERLRAQAIASLVPFFMDGPSSDPDTARAMIQALLHDYNAATPKELQLSAQVIALGWAALGCLRTAAAVKNLSTDDMLSLQDDAIALNRASLRSDKALQARRKDRSRNPHAMTPQNTNWDEGGFQLVINRALDKLNNANAKLAAYMTAIAPADQAPKLDVLFAEQMTPAVLARRARS